MSEPNYQNLINEIIKKQMDLLGPQVAVSKASKVEGLEVSSEGSVTAIKGDPQEVLQKLVQEYISLSGEIVRNILGPVFEKYPDIKLKI